MEDVKRNKEPAEAEYLPQPNNENSEKRSVAHYYNFIIRAN